MGEKRRVRVLFSLFVGLLLAMAVTAWLVRWNTPEPLMDPLNRQGETGDLVSVRSGWSVRVYEFDEAADRRLKELLGRYQTESVFQTLNAYFPRDSLAEPVVVYTHTWFRGELCEVYLGTDCIVYDSSENWVRRIQNGEKLQAEILELVEGLPFRDY